MTLIKRDSLPCHGARLYRIYAVQRGGKEALDPHKMNIVLHSGCGRVSACVKLQRFCKNSRSLAT